MTKAKQQPSPLDSNVGSYARGRNGGYFCEGYTTLREVLTNPREQDIEYIKLYRKTKDKEIKARLTAYTPCGYYPEERSIKSKLRYITGQVQLDFDNDKAKLKEIFDSCKWITAAGLSAGGKGMFILVNTDGSNYGGHFHALVEYFKINYGKQVDLAVSSINELRFVSLPEETMLREHPTLWTLTKEPPESVFDSVGIVGTGEVIEVPKEKIGKLHYHDLSSYAGVSNSNGVPLERAADYITTIAFDKTSHLYNKPAAVRAVLERHYEKYKDQHGEAGPRITMMKKNELTSNIELPVLKFSKKSSMDVHALQVVRTVLNHYSIVVDINKVAYKYNGKFWELVNSNQLDQFLVSSAEACGYAPSLAGTLRFRELLVKICYKEAGIGLLETDRFSFNLSNGIVVFNQDKTVTFAEHDQSRYFTHILPYKYDPKAKCPRFDAFLNRVMPDKYNQDTFFQYVASVFNTGRIEKMLFLIGAGANGKSTLFDVIEALFGESCGFANLQALTTPERSATAALSMYNKLLATNHDARGIVDQELFKTIASRDKLAIRALYKDNIITDNYARLLIGMNSWPTIEATHGAQRRMIAIPMDVRITEDEQDDHLRDKLKAELSGIFNKIVEAHVNFKGIVISESARALTKELIEESDNVLQFLKEEGEGLIIPGGGNLHQVHTLYDSFKEYCMQAGIRHVLGRKAFSKRLRVLLGDPKDIKDNGMVRLGWKRNVVELYVNSLK